MIKLQQAASLFLLAASTCESFIQPTKPFQSQRGSIVFPTSTLTRAAASSDTTQVNGATVPSKETGISTSTDEDYPQNFTGRLWFCPSLVKVPPKGKARPGSDVKVISLFGYSLGGTVTLEYDTSPVGPYREYVTMSALVMKKGAIGQWGSRLYVSTPEAERVCQELWGVPAELANIDFCERREGSDDDDGGGGGGSSSSSLQVTLPPNPSVSSDIHIRVEGWKNTRVLLKEDYEYAAEKSPKRWGGVPVYWTPTIKALWGPFIPFANDKDDQVNVNGDGDGDGDAKDGLLLPLHKLRLSASAIRLHWSGLERDIKVDNFSEEDYNLGIPLGLSLIVDNVLIEIGKRCESDL